MMGLRFVRKTVWQRCVLSRAFAVAALAALLAGGAQAGTDFNGNGMSDVWELLFGAGGLAPGVDTDGDGKSNLQESIAGTDPFDAQSWLKISRWEAPGGTIIVGWPNQPGKRYQLQSRPDPVAGSWQNEGGLLSGSGIELTTTVEPTGTTMFFRVVVSDTDTDGDGVNDWDEMQAGYSPHTRYSQGTATNDQTAIEQAWTATNVVSVIASSPFASEDGPTPGVFTVQRAGNFDAITVNYTVGGTATGGVDYVALPGSVTLPVGAASATINVTPIVNALLQPSRLVTLTLATNAGYVLGSPTSASVVIKDSAAPVGTGLLGNYYDNSSSTYTSTNNFAPLKITRVDPTIDFNWAAGQPYTSVSNDNFSARWNAVLVPSTNGAFTFDLQADDGARLYLTNSLLIDGWVAGSSSTSPIQSASVDLVAGSNYPIRVEFYERTNNAAVWLRWRLPGSGSFASIPTNNIWNPTFTARRWSATYFNNTNLSGAYVSSNQESAVYYNWSSGTPGPSVAVDTWTARWTGQVQPEFSETYTFVTRTDDGVKLWVNGQLIIDKWQTQTATDWTGEINLAAGVRYDIKMEYFENTSTASAQLSWHSPSQVKQVIPMERLYPTNTGPASVTSAATAVGIMGGPFSFTVTGNGTNLGFTATNLPPGLVFNPLTGVLSGTPTTSGVWQVILSASNSFSRGYSVLDLTILDTQRYVTQEVWTNVAGASVTNIPVTTAAPLTNVLTNLSTQVNWADNYGSRIRGYITPPVTGNYRFWIASDDASEFWLSTDDEPINSVLRCWVTNAVPALAWTNSPTQASSILALTAGQKYFFQVLHKEDASSDHCAVGWTQPSQTNSVPSEIVPAYALSPYVPPSAQTGQETLYVATLTPQGSAVSSGSGLASLRLNADETVATITLSYGNLTSAQTAIHVHDASRGGLIIFDLDDAPIVNGAYQWVLEPVGGLSVADILAVIKSGNAFVNVHTANYPAGEIKGFFQLSTGSQSFTPPAAPPPLPPGTPTAEEAARFLMQASFGPTSNSIAEVQSLGYDGWITQQLNTSMTSHLAWVNAYYATFPNTVTNSYPVHNAWWSCAINAADQLRMRMAFALSQIQVVSMNGGPLAQQPWGVAAYYDVLASNAFGNFRQLIEDVTLSPAMGLYLDMLKNEKPNPATGKIPNENYAREILQLFSIGLTKLHPDGSLMLDSAGLPIPTYNQDTIIGFAHVFTGWSYYTTNQNWNASNDLIRPMTLVTNRHDDLNTKLLLNNVVLPANQGGAKDLKDALDLIFNHPNVGPFICRQLIQRLTLSNPSHGYLYRVASAFADNGAGVRGDMKAVIRAILLDPEARGTNAFYNIGYGKLREPLLRTAHVIRAMRGSSPSGYWRLNITDSQLGQTPLYAPTVFNFFLPDYSYPGEIAAAGLYSPEFEITTDTTVIQVANFMQTGVYNANGFNNDAALNLIPERDMALDPAGLVDHLNTLLVAGRLSSGTRQRIIDHLNTLPAATDTDRLNRARAAVHLVVTSPDFAIQR